MSEKIFKPVADAFALIHAGGAPYQWTTNAVEAVAWLDENPKYSVKEYVSLERYQAAVSDNIAALQQKLDAVVAENVALKGFGNKLNDMHNNLNGEGTGIQGRAEVACQQVALEAAMEEFDAIKTPATDALLNAVRADAIDSAAEKAGQYAQQLKVGTDGWHKWKLAVMFLVGEAQSLRAETDTTPSQYESLAGGK